MLCPKCNKTIKDDSVECLSCGIIITKYRPVEPLNSSIEVSEAETRATPTKIPYFKIGIVAATVILLWVIFKPTYIPEVTAVSLKNNESVTISCDTKEKCVVVYLAPW